MQNVYPFWKTGRQFLQKLNIKLAHDPRLRSCANFMLLGINIYPRELKTNVYPRIKVHSSNICNSKQVNSPNAHQLMSEF